MKLFPAILLLGAAALAPETRAEEAPVRVVTVVAEKTGTVEREISLTGTVTPRREARLSSRTEGLLAEVRVEEGGVVKSGDVLATLDTRLAEIALELIRAEIGEAEIEVAEAKRREEEVRELSQTGGFARSEAETRKTAVRLREALLRRLQVREQQQAELIERHNLIAPFDGVIVEKIAEEGEWVESGTPVFLLVETDRPRFDLRVPQEFLARVAAAERVRVSLDAFPERILEAKIGVMVPVKDPESRTFLTRLELPDPERLAAPGMSGSATILYRSDRGGSVRIPRDAAVRFPDGTVKVWVVAKTESGHRVDARIIKTGDSLGDFLEVVEGLEGGETIVIKGNEGLRDGQPVVVADGAATAQTP